MSSEEMIIPAYLSNQNKNNSPSITLKPPNQLLKKISEPNKIFNEIIIDASSNSNNTALTDLNINNYNNSAELDSMCKFIIKG